MMQTHTQSLYYQEHKGFTLIELVVVIGIIIVLLSISLVVYQKQVVAAQENAVRQYVSNIVQALEDFKNSFGQYPVGNYTSLVNELTCQGAINKPSAVDRFGRPAIPLINSLVFNKLRQLASVSYTGTTNSYTLTVYTNSGKTFTYTGKIDTDTVYP
ncbi:MAG: prepilin-type N-terminal cleavage/methylation domain-containing protein [Conexivisphaerales archaeon]